MNAILEGRPGPLAGEHTVVLAGNPNVGKSVVFNGLTGMYVNVSNFPGTTVDVPRGKLNDRAMLRDTPGVYGLSGLSEEELVAEKTIMQGDVIINVVSALSLERDLFLTQQIIDFGKPVIVALNQMDEARARHIEIDVDRLSNTLGVPVIPCVAVLGEGIDAIKTRYGEARLGHPTPDSPPPQEVIRLEENPGERMKLYGLRRHYVNAVARSVASQKDTAQTHWAKRLSKKLGQWFLHPLVGIASMIAVLLALYQIVGVWVAGDVVDFTEGVIMLEHVVPFLQGLVSQAVPRDFWLYGVLAGEFGVLTMSIQYIYGVLFPLVLGFYIYISLLEDCGYLPRIAVLSDSLLSRVGLNGRAVIPLILGFGCVTMATVSTRVLTSQRERTIASTLLAITIPCSAQLAVIMGLMAVSGGLKAWFLYIGVLFVLMVGIGSVLNLILPGKSTPLVLDLPPMRVPSLKNVLRKTWVRTKAFINEAAPLFVLGSLIVSVLQVTGMLVNIQSWLSPVTMNLLHLPGETAQAFVMGMVRRDFGAAGLFGLQDVMTPVQMLTALVVITLFVPCIASATVFWKERGLKEATTILLGSWLLAFGAGAILCRLLELIPII